MSPGGPPTLPDRFQNERERDGMLRSYAIEDLSSRVLRMTRPKRADANSSAGSLIKMPADLLIFSTNDLKVDNSSLTGEAEPQAWP